MTTHALPNLRLIQVLLNTLVGEHYVQRSLLREVCDLLHAGGGALSCAHETALDLLAALEQNISAADFDARILRIRLELERSPLAGAGDRALAG
jgi:hypothetical protein